MTKPSSIGPVTLTVCVTCRRGEELDDDTPRPGARMLAAIEQNAIPDNVRVVGVKCLSACSNGCSVALTGPGRWSYIYGNLDPIEHPDAIVDGAARYAQTTDGIVPWRERPEIFRKQSIARIPPQDVPQGDQS